MSIGRFFMGLFTKKVKVYEAKGKKQEWKELRKAMKEAGVRQISADRWEDEPPVCGCGAKLDVRDFGPNGRIDRDVYTIRVPESERDKAQELVKQLIPDYIPYQREKKA